MKLKKIIFILLISLVLFIVYVLGATYGSSAGVTYSVGALTVDVPAGYKIANCSSSPIGIIYVDDFTVADNTSVYIFKEGVSLAFTAWKGEPKLENGWCSNYIPSGTGYLEGNAQPVEFKVNGVEHKAVDFFYDEHVAIFLSEEEKGEEGSEVEGQYNVNLGYSYCSENQGCFTLIGEMDKDVYYREIENVRRIVDSIKVYYDNLPFTPEGFFNPDTAK